MSELDDNLPDGPDVPRGYWERLMAWMKRIPELPEDDKSGDPEPLG